MTRPVAELQRHVDRLTKFGKGEKEEDVFSVACRRGNGFVSQRRVHPQASLITSKTMAEDSSATMSQAARRRRRGVAIDRRVGESVHRNVA